MTLPHLKNMQLFFILQIVLEDVISLTFNLQYTLTPSGNISVRFQRHLWVLFVMLTQIKHQYTTVQPFKTHHLQSRNLCCEFSKKNMCWLPYWHATHNKADEVDIYIYIQYVFKCQNTVFHHPKQMWLISKMLHPKKLQCIAIVNCIGSYHLLPCSLCAPHDGAQEQSSLFPRTWLDTTTPPCGDQAAAAAPFKMRPSSGSSNNFFNLFW